ncbi:MAG: protein kinase [Syntrophomonas sp.]
MDTNHLCMGCMNDKGTEEVCPYCGYVEGTPPELPQFLTPGTILNGRYLLGKVLGYGGFGITYLGWDLILNSKLAVKEYLPQSVATRVMGQTTVTAFSTGEAQDNFTYGLNKFLDEARALAQFMDHPGIVGVRDFFQANATAYLVMQYMEGMTFKDYLQEKGGAIPVDVALSIMMPAMDALREVHQKGIVHRDISPDNIYIMANGQVKLLDFGAARHAVGEHSKSLSIILKAGYAPEEQYRSRGEQGPWTDIYAVGATLYRAITGKIPPEALDRMFNDTLEPPSHLGVAISPDMEAALVQALAVKASNRFQSIEAFQKALGGNRTASIPPTPQVSAAPPTSPPPVGPVSGQPSGPAPGGGVSIQVAPPSSVISVQPAGSPGPVAAVAPRPKSSTGKKVAIGIGAAFLVMVLAVIGLAYIGSNTRTTGSLTLSDGSKYDGEIMKNKPDGQGTMTYSNGDKYQGQFKEGKREGTGSYTGGDGSVLVGTWQSDELAGDATITKTDGSKYVGQLKNFKADGKGTMTLADGSKYDGEWKDNQRSGYGILTEPNGDRYEGQWKNDKRDGKGVLITQNFRYDGQWKEGRAEGYGVITYTDGNKYEGEFKDNAAEGRGTGTVDGETLSGRWSNNTYLGP